MRTTMIVVAMLVAAKTQAAERELFCRAEVLEQSWQLLKSARYGLGRQEQAAFVVEQPDGALSFVVWPSTGASMETHFHGALPAHTVAIVHTHPLGKLIPSSDDRDTARRLGIPVYVLVRTGVTRTLGDGVETLLVGDWNPEERRPALACH
jgi:proteasome lid subunit RPN8/RPN11